MSIDSTASVLSFPLGKMSAGILLEESALCIDTGNYDGASQLLENVLQRNPDNADAWVQLGIVADKKGNLDLATTLFKNAILLKPEFCLSYLRLADVYVRLSRIDEAKEILQYIASKKETWQIPEFYLLLWTIERSGNSFNSAKKYLQRYLRMVSKSTNHKQKMPKRLIAEYGILAACDVEPILGSEEEETRNLQNFVNHANELLKTGKSTTGLPSSTPNVLFQMAYYNVNPRSYLEKAAELYRKIFPDLCWTSPHCKNQSVVKKTGKIKLGIVSTHLDCFHAVGYCFAPLVRFLPRDIFEIIHFKNPSSGEVSVPDLKGWLGCVTSVPLPVNVKSAREIIANYAVDILWYTDIIMVEHSTMLAHSRLAPIQCVSAGHPVTSGLKTIDYFISSRFQETASAQENYTEKLIRLPCFPIIYPEFHLHQNTLTRESLGLPEKGRLYLCCQTPFKINPAMDEVFKKILERDEEAIVVFSYAENHYADQLQARLEKSLKDLRARCYFVNRLEQDKFIMFLDRVDVILDTFPFGGGNTTLQSFAVNQPMVHLASSYLRSRGTAGSMEILGLQELIANTKEDYVEIALKLGKDKAYRKSMSQRILKNKHILFNQEDTIKAAYAKLFLDLYHQQNLEEYFS